MHNDNFHKKHSKAFPWVGLLIYTSISTRYYYTGVQIMTFFCTNATVTSVLPYSFNQAEVVKHPLCTHWAIEEIKSVLSIETKKGKLKKPRLIVVGGSAGWKSRLLQCLLLQMQIDETQEQKVKGYCSPATFHLKQEDFQTSSCANLLVKMEETHLFLVCHKQIIWLCFFFF